MINLLTGLSLKFHSTDLLFKINIITKVIYIFLAIVINPEMLFPLIMHNINRNVQKYAEIIFHIFPPYVFSCAIGNFIAIKLYNNECAEDNDCENEFAMEDPCCCEPKTIDKYYGH